jgi:hypothetical protein
MGKAGYVDLLPGYGKKKQVLKFELKKHNKQMSH